MIFNDFLDMWELYKPAISFSLGLSLGLSCIGIFFTIRNYFRKSGVFIRGDFATGMPSTIDKNYYVSKIIIENMKDRAISIFGIYLKIGYSFYLELESLEPPLILKAFESYEKEYGSVEFYSVNLTKLDINKLFESKKIKKRLVLSTSEGKYFIQSTIPRWTPVSEDLRNDKVFVVRPKCLQHKGKYVGANIKYIIELIYENGQERVVHLRPESYMYHIFQNFPLTWESLKSKEKLNQYLELKQKEGLLICKSFLVHDVDEWRKNDRYLYSDSIVQANIKEQNPFNVYVIGKISRWVSTWKIKRENNRFRRKK